jgi:hypothetical protein
VPELHIKIGKRGEEQQHNKASISTKVDLLKSKLEWMEDAVMSQAGEFRSELASA